MEHGTRVLAQVRQAAALLEAASRSIPDANEKEAVELARAFARAEKLAMAATRRALLRAGDDGARHHGGERDMASLAASLCGTTVAKAGKGLRSARALETVTSGRAAFIDGSLSLDQAQVVADAAVAAPAATPELVAAAGQTSLSGLRARAAAAIAAKRGEEAVQDRERRLAARRFCHIQAAPGGGVRVEALLPTAEGAALLGAVAHATDVVWRSARQRGCNLSMDQARADALVALCRGGGTSEPAGGSPDLILTVDAAALVRGEVRDGEQCVIDGVGPVPVAHARSLLGEAFLTMCVTDGQDVRTLTSTNRVVPARVRKALMLRDPACVVPGCGQRMHLEIDHWRLDFGRGGLTAIDNLCRLCAPHHRLKTRTGWRLDGGPGRWRWLPPRRGSPAQAAPAGPLPAPAAAAAADSTAAGSTPVALGPAVSSSH